MTHPHFVVLVALPLLAGAVPAQRCVYVPDNSLGSGSGNVIPFGHVSPTNGSWSNQKYQTLVPASTLGTVPGRICELAFVPRTTGTRQFASIVIKMAQTKATTLTTTFATNLGSNPTTVLDARDYVWTNPQMQWTRIGLQTPFLFIPTLGNLVLDIEVRGAGMPDSSGTHPGFRSVSQVRMYAFGWTTSPPATGRLAGSSGLAMELCFDTNDAHAFGRGCKGSNGKVPRLSFSGNAKLGGTLTLNLADALASRPVLVVMGLSNAAPYPVDLTAAGAPGCSLYESLDVPSTTVTSSNGTVAIPIAIPNDSALACVKFYNQFFPHDPAANALDFTASNYGRVLLGH